MRALTKITLPTAPGHRLVAAGALGDAGGTTEGRAVYNVSSALRDGGWRCKGFRPPGGRFSSWCGDGGGDSSTQGDEVALERGGGPGPLLYFRLPILRKNTEENNGDGRESRTTERSAGPLTCRSVANPRDLSAENRGS